MANPNECLRIKVSIEVTHAVNADYEEEITGPTRAEWDAMSQEERAQWLDEVAQITRDNQISAYAVVTED